MENEPYDYRQYDQIWRRVAPQENPYPEVRRAAGGSVRTDGSAQAPSVSAMPRSGMDTPRADVPRITAADNTACSAAMRALLHEELRHMTEVLHLLENALA